MVYLGLMIVAAYPVGHYFYQVDRYHRREDVARGNREFAALYDARRSGGIVTVTGVAQSDAEIDDDGPTVPIALAGDSRIVDLTAGSGVCANDSVAATGVYHYALGGGWVDVSHGSVDVIPSSRRSASSTGRRYSILRLISREFVPNWCW
ncbi:MAG TPA: hypothetical protein VK760_08270 [Candidatus Acidoferrales bacterium]|jgi:hypothetical protein|nr:hypothetical protein [Candidatus Acidoferrales bacterium]